MFQGQVQRTIPRSLYTHNKEMLRVWQSLRILFYNQRSWLNPTELMYDQIIIEAPKNASYYESKSVGGGQISAFKDIKLTLRPHPEL